MGIGHCERVIGCIVGAAGREAVVNESIRDALLDSGMNAAGIKRDDVHAVPKIAIYIPPRRPFGFPHNFSCVLAYSPAPTMRGLRSGLPGDRLFPGYCLYVATSCTLHAALRAH